MSVFDSLGCDFVTIFVLNQIAQKTNEYKVISRMYQRESITVEIDHFEAMEDEVHRFIVDSHWEPFVRSLRALC